MITLYYWSLIKTEAAHRYRPFMPDYASHLHPLLAMLFDFSMVHAPYKLRHIPFTIVMCCIYCFCCNMPMALMGKPAYTLITWKSGASIALIVGLFVFVMLMHAMFVGLSYCCKAKIYKRNFKI